MAFISLSSGSATFLSLADGDRLVIAQGVLRTGSNDAVRLSHADMSISVFGELYGGDDGLQATGGNTTITIGDTGKVVAVTSLSDDKSAIELGGSDSNDILNYGSISGNVGVDGSESEETRVSNFGSISGHLTAVILGKSAILDNFGIIRGNVVGNGISVKNFGTIDGSITVTASNSRISSIVNRGEIDGSIQSIGTSSDIFDLRDGIITGFVAGRAGDDTYIINESINRSDFVSDPLLEFANEGSDHVRSYVSFELPSNFESLKLAGAENLDGTGNAGNETLQGNSGNNWLSGLEGDDTLSGNAGNDILIGGDGADTLEGNSGDDHLRGQTGSDELSGGAGDDRLNGGLNNDRLSGGNGDDILRGHGGSDRLSGGRGQDTFLFRRAVESGPGSQSDIISDFNPGEDRIDLSTVSREPFLLKFGGSFDGRSPTVKLVEQSGRTLVQVDADGDGRADMRIVLQGTTGVSEDDFLL